MSHDHKPNRPDERERVEKLGGRVIHYGTWYELAFDDCSSNSSLHIYVSIWHEHSSLTFFCLYSYSCCSCGCCISHALGVCKVFLLFLVLSVISAWKHMSQVILILKLMNWKKEVSRVSLYWKENSAVIFIVVQLAPFSHNIHDLDFSSNFASVISVLISMFDMINRWLFNFSFRWCLGCPQKSSCSWYCFKGFERVFWQSYFYQQQQLNLYCYSTCS
jgi:hypothetical protein